MVGGFRNGEPYTLVADFEVPAYLDDQARKACTRVGDTLGVEVKGLRINVARAREDIERMVGQRLPATMKAVFLSGRHAILMTQPGSPAEAYVMIAHELTHLLTVEIPRIQDLMIPPWFFEGLAEYVSEQDRFSSQLGRPLLENNAKRLAATDRWIAFDGGKDLSWWMSGSATPDEMGLVFTQGYSWVKWLAQQHGDRILRDIHQALGAGEDFPRAIQTLTGHSVAQNIESWKKSVIRSPSPQPDKHEH